MTASSIRRRVSLALIVCVLAVVAVFSYQALLKARHDGKVKMAVSGAAVICRDLGAKQVCPPSAEGQDGDVDPWRRAYECFHSADGMLSVGSRGAIVGEGSALDAFEVVCVSEVLSDSFIACYCDRTNQ